MWGFTGFLFHCHWTSFQYCYTSWELIITCKTFPFSNKDMIWITLLPTGCQSLFYRFQSKQYVLVGKRWCVARRENTWNNVMLPCCHQRPCVKRAGLVSGKNTVHITNTHNVYLYGSGSQLHLSPVSGPKINLRGLQNIKGIQAFLSFFFFLLFPCEILDMFFRPFNETIWEGKVIPGLRCFKWLFTH